MKPFPDPLNLEDAGMKGDSRVFRLMGRFRYLSSLGCITVPHRFETDGASIPRCFWGILQPFGPWFHSAVIHDFLYSPLNDDFTRDEADFIFLEAMRVLGVGFVKRRTIWSAVRLFGGSSFRAKIANL